MLTTCRWTKSKNEFELEKLEYWVPSVFSKCEAMEAGGKDKRAVSFFLLFEGSLQLLINLALAFAISIYYITWVQAHVGCSYCPGDVVYDHGHIRTHAYLARHRLPPCFPCSNVAQVHSQRRFHSFPFITCCLQVDLTATTLM